MTASGDTPVTTRDGVEILPPHECWALLRSAEVGRLAVSIMNRPDIFPVNHIVYHGRGKWRDPLTVPSPG